MTRSFKYALPMLAVLTVAVLAWVASLHRPKAEDTRVEYWPEGPLHIAIELGDADRIRELLDAGVDPNKGIGDGWYDPVTTPVDLAIMRGKMDILKLLLDNGGKLDAGTVEVASCAGQLEMLKFLVEEKGLRGDSPGDLGDIPLLSAIRSDQIKAAEYLVDKTEMTDEVKHWLAMLVERKGQNAYRLLKRTGALENQGIRRTVYLGALRTGESHIVAELLKFGVVPTFPTQTWGNGIEMALLPPPNGSGKRRAINLAIKAGARADIRALEWLFADHSKNEIPKDAARFYRDAGTFEGVELSDVDRLMLATLCRDTREIRRLGARGVDPDLETAGARFPLEMAIMYCNLETVRALLEIGADPNPQEVNGHHNLLGLARSYGEPGMEQALISAGARSASSIH